MHKALVVKELREATGLLVAAAIALVWAVGQLSGFPLLPNWIGNSLGYYGPGGGVPFVSNNFVFYATAVLGALAIGLGLKQTVWEDAHGTFRFLLHRPVARSAVFAAKVVVAIGSLVALLAAAIVAHGWWAATPGEFAGPFEWSMTLPAWRLALVLPLVYLGAVSSGLRKARWFGTRLAPLAAAILWAILVYAVAFWWGALLLAAVGYAFAAATAIQFVSQRDF